MGEKPGFLFNQRSCNDKGCQVLDGQAVFSEFASVIAVYCFIVQLYKGVFKNDAVRQYTIQYLKIKLLEVEFHLESIPQCQPASASEIEGINRIGCLITI